MNKWILLFLFSLSVPLFGNEEAIQKLIKGNQRYVKGHRESTISVQSPFAVVVACSDSRVAPEIIFDQGLGDLFVVRVAGNVVGALEMESINYAIDHLGSQLVMVMGHEHCGAVQAVREHQIADIKAIADIIAPSIKGTESLEGAIKANVRGVVDYLRKFLNVQVIGGYYDFETGEVEILHHYHPSGAVK